MNKTKFSPGFRLSAFDLVILLVGSVGVVYLGSSAGWTGLIIGVVVLHFFLFCNVFRISRLSELIWAGFFIILTGLTITTGWPGWIAAIGSSIALSTFLIWKETKKEYYHGVFWETLNPNLPAWWHSNQSESSGSANAVKRH